MIDRSVIRHESMPAARRAFSLAELATVIILGVLLFGLAAPTLDSIRDQSRQSICLERLGIIAEAGRTYAADDPQGWGIPVHPLQYRQCEHQGQGPPCPNPSFIGAYEWGGKSGNGSPQAQYGSTEGEYAWIASKYGTKAGFGPATRPLNRVLYPGGFKNNYNESDGLDFQGSFLDTLLDLDIYRCPSDNGPPGGAHCWDWLNYPERSSYDHFGNSYAANIFMTASSSGGEMNSNSPYLRPMSRVPNPARTIAYEENIGRWAWGCRREKADCLWINNGIDPGPTKAVRGWHGKDWTFNRSFIDGHAELQSVYLEGTEDGNGYAEHYYSEHLSSYPQRPGCYNDTPSEGSFELYRCLIVRGPGWQKDTMPAELICTGLNFSGAGRASYDGCVGVE